VSADPPVNLGAKNSKNGVVQIQGGDAMFSRVGLVKPVESADVFGEGQQKVNYYAHPVVRARMAEFLGMEPRVPDAISAVVMIGDACQTGYRNVRRVNELPLCLEHDFEVSRSLWDSASLLIDLDIEYVNFDFPAEPYIHPDRAFALQETVIATAENQLRSLGIAPLHLLSGRGHHSS
jgi:hypothetical protein